MAVTTNTIRGVAVTNLFIFGLIGCSNTPAPWTQEDESPWGAKHEAQANQAASDEAVTDTSLDDPVLLADPDVEAIVMDAPEAAPAPEVIVPVVVEDTCELIRALSVMEKHNLGDLLVVKEGKLVGIASRVDIGRAFLISWPISPADEQEAP